MIVIINFDSHFYNRAIEQDRALCEFDKTSEMEKEEKEYKGPEYNRFDEEEHGVSFRPKSSRSTPIIVGVVVALVAFFTVVLVLAIALGVTLNRGSIQAAHCLLS